MSLADAKAVTTGSSPTAEVAHGLAIPFVLGPLRGNWWQLASGGKVARLLLGTYEQEQSALFQKHIHAGDQVLDIGAAAGYYTLLAAKLVGPAGRVVAFEPDPTNLRYLRAHVLQNGLDQVSVLPIALADSSGTARFGSGTGSGTGRLTDEGQAEVAVRRLDDLAAEKCFAPQRVKIDVEGAEVAVLRGGERLIREHRPTIFLSTHEWITSGVHRACCDLLEAWGYRLQPIVGPSVAAASELLCLPE
jgi:FkbM family methyltransferase